MTEKERQEWQLVKKLVKKFWDWAHLKNPKSGSPINDMAKRVVDYGVSGLEDEDQSEVFLSLGAFAAGYLLAKQEVNHAAE